MFHKCRGRGSKSVLIYRQQRKKTQDFVSICHSILLNETNWPGTNKQAGAHMINCQVIYIALSGNVVDFLHFMEPNKAQATSSWSESRINALGKRTRIDPSVKQNNRISSFFFYSCLWPWGLWSSLQKASSSSKDSSYRGFSGTSKPRSWLLV